MSTRNKPVAVVGLVNVLAPTGSSAYFRLTWTGPDGRPGRTSGGRDQATAMVKAEMIDADLQRACGGDSVTTLADIVAEYVATPVGRNQRRRNGRASGDWTPGHHTQVRRTLNRVLRGYADVRAYEVDRSVLDRMRAQAGTPTTVAENTSALRGLLRWGAMHGYFSLEQSDLLPQRCLPVAPASPSPARPPRRRPDREVGEHEDYIRDEDAPSVAQVAAVGDSLQSRLANGRLSAEVAAEVGLRWGEQFQLTDRDITVVDGVVMVRVIAQVNWAARRSAGDPVRKLPKGEKTRSVPVPDVSQTGYPLRDELLSATERARQERLEGTNPEGLLFPTVTGKIFTHTGFMRDYFFPAAEQAGWPIDRWTETRTDGTTRQRRQLRHPWHSLRHRYARTCVDVYRYTEGELMAAGGWENKDVVSNRYYKHGSEHLKSAIAKLLASR